jgi:hypothetical protein
MAIAFGRALTIARTLKRIAIACLRRMAIAFDQFLTI